MISRKFINLYTQTLLLLASALLFAACGSTTPWVTGALGTSTPILPDGDTDTTLRATIKALESQLTPSVEEIASLTPEPSETATSIVKNTPTASPPPTVAAPVAVYEGVTNTQGVKFGVEKIEFTPGNRMRLYFWVWNDTNTNCSLFFDISRAYISLEGIKYPVIASSLQSSRNVLEAKVRQTYWYEVESPERMTDIMTVNLGLDPGSAPIISPCVIDIAIFEMPLQ